MLIAGFNPGFCPQRHAARPSTWNNCGMLSKSQKAGGYLPKRMFKGAGFCLMDA
jgi:hypothetical protein